MMGQRDLFVGQFCYSIEIVNGENIDVPERSLPIEPGFLLTIFRQDHELVVLVGRIDWDGFVDALQAKFSKNGCKAKRLRLMIGLHLLKHLYNLSDETVCNMLDENLYFRYFCGVDSDVTKWMSKKLLNACTILT
jgi:hypothetical protein